MTTPAQLKSFNQTTLNDNWFEERAKPLNGVIANYGANDWTTSSKSEFARPGVSRSTSGIRTKAYKQMKRDQARRLNDERDSLTGLVAAYNNKLVSVESHGEGFGSTLPQPDAGSSLRHLQTSNQLDFGKGKKQSNTNKRFMHGPNAPSGGGAAGAREEKGMSTSGMAGEVFKTNSDPQQNTAAQRSWVYGTDPAITIKNNPGSYTAKPALGVSLRLGETGKIKPGPRQSTTLTKGGGGTFMDD
jgi:hypothetical protein